MNLIRKCHNEQCGGMVYCVRRGVEGIVDAEGVADAERVDDAEGVADAERVDDAEGWEAERSCWLE